jgi:hypothetical protein
VFLLLAAEDSNPNSTWASPGQTIQVAKAANRSKGPQALVNAAKFKAAGREYRNPDIALN